MFLEKLKKNFSHRSLSLCLCFLVFVSVFNIQKPRKVYANPIVVPVVEELGPIVISILASMGIVVSIPVASDFVEWTKEHSANADLPTWNNEGLMSYAPKAIQGVKDGYYASKSFVEGLLQEWDAYCTAKNVVSSTQDNSITFDFTSYHTVSSSIRWDKYYAKLFKNIQFTAPAGCTEFYTCVGYDSSYSSKEYLPNTSWVVKKQYSPDLFNQPIHFSFSSGNLYYEIGSRDICYRTAYRNFIDYIDSIRVVFGEYQSKPQVSKKVIDNTLNPVNSQNQGMLITPEQTEAIGKVLDPSIPDVQNGSVSTTAPITSVASDVPNFVDGSKVGALSWGADGTVDNTGSIDKPTDGTGSIDKPTDGTGSIGGFLGAILDILKKILDWIENFFKALLEFLKYILVPSDGYFVDTFNHFRADLEGKFGFDTGPLKDLSSNSSVVTPQFIYNFSVLGVPVTLDFSFIVKVVPYCHIIFGGLTAIFLCWYNLRNILLIIRGTSYIEGSNSTGQSEKRG